jgi:hypothetical protein
MTFLMFQDLAVKISSPKFSMTVNVNVSAYNDETMKSEDIQ